MSATVPDVWLGFVTPVFVGIGLGLLLTGVFILGALVYLKTHSGDHSFNRLTIIVLLFLVCAETGVQGYQAYRFAVLHDADLSTLLLTELAWWRITPYFFNALIAMVCEGFMGWRIVRFGSAMSAWYSAKYDVARWAVYGTLGLVWVGAFCSTMFLIFWPLVLSNPIMIWVSGTTEYEMFQRGTLAQSSLYMATDVFITVLTTVQFRLARTGFSSSTRDLNILASVVIRNGAIFLLLQICYTILILRALTWLELLLGFISRIHALTILCILTEPKHIRSIEASRRAASGPTESAMPTLFTDQGAGEGDGAGAKAKLSAGAVSSIPTLPFSAAISPVVKGTSAMGTYEPAGQQPVMRPVQEGEGQSASGLSFQEWLSFEEGRRQSETLI